MAKLEIYETRQPKLGVPHKKFEKALEFDTSSQAELRALLWLTYCPDDIVMLVEEEQCSSSASTSS